MHFIKKIIVHLLGNALWLWGLTKIFHSQFILHGEWIVLWENLLITGIIFSLVNTFIKPLMKLLSFPLMIGSLGLFTFVINALVLIIVTNLTDSYTINADTIDWFLLAMKGSFIISLIHGTITFIFDK